MNSPRITLPSRYEDLDEAFRGRLRANRELLDVVQRANSSMQVSGGIRFLSIFGLSGSGKTSATRELGTHLPNCKVVLLSRESIEDRGALEAELTSALRNRGQASLFVAVVDQYEESVAEREGVPSRFVESLSLLDRGELRSEGVLFLWLTTRKEFQRGLQDATTRNARILLAADFELAGPRVDDWPDITDETFRFHNQERTLADFEVIEEDLREISRNAETVGGAIEDVGQRLAGHTKTLQELSDYTVVMLWPVTDGLRITRIQQFTDPRQGYRLDWNSWYRQLNAEDRRQLPLREYNRTRLYFDMRLVPIAADLHPLCRDLAQDEVVMHRSYLERFSKTHFASIVRGDWNSDGYTPLRERESERANRARDWYPTVTNHPTRIGRRIAQALRDLGINATHEKTVTSPHGRVRADVYARRATAPTQVLVEVKALAPSNTMPSTIAQSVLVTLRRHSQFAGFVGRQ